MLLVTASIKSVGGFPSMIPFTETNNAIGPSSGCMRKGNQEILYKVWLS